MKQKLQLVLANPMSAVSSLLQIFPDSPSGGGPKSPEELRAMTESLEKALDPQIARLKEIQDRHQDEVLQIPGVQGIGIGLDQNGLGFVFHVYVTAQATATVPRAIEGVPVQLVETGGPFEAFSAVLLKGVRWPRLRATPPQVARNQH